MYRVDSSVGETPQPESQAARRRRSNVKYKSSLQGKACVMICDARARARRKGVEFRLDTAHIEYLWERQGGSCALTGIPMTRVAGGGRQASNVSLDRIDPSRGYVPGNVQLACAAANTVKSALSEDELVSWCLGIVNTYAQKRDLVVEVRDRRPSRGDPRPPKPRVRQPRRRAAHGA